MTLKSQRIKNYVKAVTSAALGRAAAGRNATVFPDDVFLVSYFRSGSTWARFLLGNFSHQNEPVTFANVDRLVPSIYVWPDRVLRTLPRVMKSHECFDPRYPKVIYIVRDARDVAVSFYYYNLKVRELPEGYPMEDFITRFIAAKTVGYADRVGSWEDHVMSWLRMRGTRSNFLLIRYEDLLSDPARELERIAPILGVDATSSRVERAISLSSAEQMRSLEKKQSHQWEATKDSRKDIPFVRDAKSGGWRNKLSETSVQQIERAWGASMQQLGYKLTTSPYAESLKV